MQLQVRLSLLIVMQDPGPHSSPEQSRQAWSTALEGHAATGSLAQLLLVAEWHAGDSNPGRASTPVCTLHYNKIAKQVAAAASG